MGWCLLRGVLMFSFIRGVLCFLFALSVLLVVLLFFLPIRLIDNLVSWVDRKFEELW